MISFKRITLITSDTIMVKRVNELIIRRIGIKYLVFIGLFDNIAPPIEP